MKLGQNTIARQEREGYLLYNRDNECLIRVNKNIFDELIVHDKKEHEKYFELYNFLYKNDFLEERPEKRLANGSENMADNNSNKADRANKEYKENCETAKNIFLNINKFLGLKSDIGPFSLIWALTPRCNLRCRYCFPDAASHSAAHKPLSTQELFKIADQLIATKVFRVTLSGGECLLVKNIWQIVKRLYEAGITVMMLSNGTNISDTVIENLIRYRVPIGISLDGPNEKINRITRGKNSFNKTVKGIERLMQSGIKPAALVTVTRYNFPFLSEHLGFLEELGITFVALQDLKPFGTKEIYDKTRLTLAQERALLPTFRDLLAEHKSLFIYPSELFIFYGGTQKGKIMQCPAGDNTAYIDFYGDLFPCSTLSSLKMGNLLDDVTLTELWQNSEGALRLREIKNMPVDKIPGCSSCLNRSQCEGGCRGDALFYSNDLFGLPSRCPKALGLFNLSENPRG